MSVSGNEIGDLLVDIGIITAEELASALDEQQRSGERLTAILDRLGLVTYHQLKDSLELQFGVNFISLAKSPPSREVADLVSEEVKRKYKLIPVANNGTQFTVAMVNPDDLIALDTLRVQLRSGHLKKVVCTADEFEHCMQTLYSDVPEATEIAEAAQAAEITEIAKVAEIPEVAASEPVTFAATEASASPPPAAVEAVKARVPAKKHLQSLFGDDDDDDFDSPAPAVASSAAPVAAEPVVPEAVDLPPVEAMPVEVVPVEAVAPEVVAPVPIESVSVQTISTEPVVSEPELPVAAPTVVREPAPPVVEKTVAADNHELTSHHTRLTQAEDVMEAALANVTSHLIESSQTALTHDASRQLLEEVVESELGGIAEETDIHRMKEAQNASVMLLAHEIIGKATQKRCSDIHLEPDASGVALRYFLHGELLADCMLPLEIHGSLVGSYKVIAGLDPQELNKPQDKKFTTRVEDDEVELRITTIPTDNGEMVAISMRFTDPNSAGAIAQALMGSQESK